MLYYLGVMQVVIQKVAWVMQACMGTTAGESLNAAGNIFVGQVKYGLGRSGDLVGSAFGFAWTR